MELINTSPPMRAGRVERKRARVLTAMTRYISSAIVQEAVNCAQKLFMLLPHRPLEENRVFVAYGGGKDSSYIVAFVRYIQLLIFQEHRSTFHLRIVTNRHAGMPFAVMENIDRIYQALELYDDPAVEMLLVDGHAVSPFRVGAPLPEEVVARNRLDILMTGHRCEGEARPTFCNACNLSMVNSFGEAAAYEGGVDVIVTGDSNRELRAYLAWVRRVAIQFGMAKKEQHTLTSFLQTMDTISQHYFKDIYGEQHPQELQSRRIRTDRIVRDPCFFSIFQDTAYAVAEHWELLTNFLGFRFDDYAFSFTESDCGNPALMAHLRGLKKERLYGLSYAEGIAEYVTFATMLMEKKDFPPHLIEAMKARYSTVEAIRAMRRKLDAYAQSAFNLSQEQLICMLYSPFVERGERLSLYLKKEQPGLYPYCEAIHRLLAGQDVESRWQDCHSLESALRKISGLDLSHLRIIYTRNISLHRRGKSATPIAVVLERDPHKAVITTSHGDVIGVSEIISGR